MPWWYLKKIHEQPFEKKRKLMTTTYFPSFGYVRWRLQREVER